jgi:hypothetical protein
MTHLGMANMEAATWHPSLPAVPKLPAAARRPVRARVAAVTISALLLAALALFGRSGPPVAPVEHGLTKWHVNFTATDAATGRPVSRQEWIDRALS